MRYQHIIWDWNGTLLDDAQAGLNAVNTMLVARALPCIDMHRYRECFGFPVKDFYRDIGFCLECEDWDAMAHEYHDLFLSDRSLQLHERVVEILEHVRYQGLAQSVLSASEQTMLTEMLDTFGIAHFFENIRGTDNLYGYSKRELGVELLAGLTSSPCHVLMIGDSLHDREVADVLGIDCVLIAQGHQSFPRLAVGQNVVLHRIDELRSWLNM